MWWSGSSLLAVVRDGMWGLLLFASVAWMAIAWSVLRLEPADIVHVAGPVILFGALAEALRACARARTWWINAGLAVLFALTGAVLLAEQDTSYTTPAALIGWYLMVRGAVDIAVATVTRQTDRIWGLLMVVGVLETGLGFFAASPLSRTADPVVVVLGGLGLLRAVADLVTGLRLREVRAARADLLDLPPERAAGVAGYAAGLSDYESQPVRNRPRHRAESRLSAARKTAGGLLTGGAGGHAGVGLLGDGVLGDGVLGNGVAGNAGVLWPGGPAAEPGAAAGGGTAADVVPGGPATGGMAGAGYVAASDPAPTAPVAHAAGMGEPVPGGPVAHVPGTGEPGQGGDTFHDAVLRTTADLDAMLALAGVSGAGVAARLPDYDIPEVPDTPESVGLLDDAEPAAAAARDLDDTAEMPVATGYAPQGDDADPPAGEPAHDSFTTRGGDRED